jgi:acyl-CoA thioesterase II
VTTSAASPGDGATTPASDLMEVLELQPRGEDRFVGLTPPTPLQRIFGGQVAGQALMAAIATVPADRPVHSLHSYFLRPGDTHEEIRFEVERLREGRSFSTRRVLARQTRKGEDVAIFALTADFHAGERPVVEHSLPMPDVPGPESLPGLDEVAAAHPGKVTNLRLMSRAVEQRYLSDPFDPTPRHAPDTVSRAWFRVTGRLPEAEAVHAAALTFVSDLTLLSAALARVGGGWGGSVVGASLDHAVWFHRPVRADEWFLYETDSPSASSGRALGLGNIWAADGTHVATVAQEGLIRSLED